MGSGGFLQQSLRLSIRAHRQYLRIVMDCRLKVWRYEDTGLVRKPSTKDLGEKHPDATQDVPKDGRLSDKELINLCLAGMTQ